MIWSAPALEPVIPSPQASPASWTSAAVAGGNAAATAASCSSSEESAAQLLLNLGQESRGAGPLPGNKIAPYSQGPPLNMERLWAGDLTQLPAAQQMQALNLTASCSAQQPQQQQQWMRNGGLVKNEAPGNVQGLQQQQQQGVQVGPPPVPLVNQQEHEEDETPMICMICEDKATGLHYGIITCEG